MKIIPRKKKKKLSSKVYTFWVVHTHTEMNAHTHTHILYMRRLNVVDVIYMFLSQLQNANNNSNE